jgi:hypothetical protein
LPFWEGVLSLVTHDVETLLAEAAVAGDSSEPAHQTIQPPSRLGRHNVLLEAARTAHIAGLDVEVLVDDH